MHLEMGQPKDFREELTNYIVTFLKESKGFSGVWVSVQLNVLVCIVQDFVKVWGKKGRIWIIFKIRETLKGKAGVLLFLLVHHSPIVAN
jgi:hypothetical protein